jgi:hypothetical protein
MRWCRKYRDTPIIMMSAVNFESVIASRGGGQGMALTFLDFAHVLEPLGHLLRVAPEEDCAGGW